MSLPQRGERGIFQEEHSYLQSQWRGTEGSLFKAGHPRSETSFLTLCPHEHSYHSLITETFYLETLHAHTSRLSIVGNHSVGGVRIPPCSWG